MILFCEKDKKSFERLPIYGVARGGVEIYGEGLNHGSKIFCEQQCKTCNERLQIRTRILN
jgi:hypothetical protein